MVELRWTVPCKAQILGTCVSLFVTLQWSTGGGGEVGCSRYFSEWTIYGVIYFFFLVSPPPKPIPSLWDHWNSIIDSKYQTVYSQRCVIAGFSFFVGMGRELCYVHMGWDDQEQLCWWAILSQTGHLVRLLCLGCAKKNMWSGQRKLMGEGENFIPNQLVRFVFITFLVTSYRDRERDWLIDYFNLKIMALCHGLIYQLVLDSLLFKETYTYNNDTITALQKNWHYQLNFSQNLQKNEDDSLLLVFIA